MIVLDASAVLALLFDEPGADLVAEYLPTALISSVNFSEVYAKIYKITKSEQLSSEILNHINFDVFDFTQELAEISGRMIFETEKFGLSFADRACFALGKKLNASILTTDKVWSRVSLGVTVKQLR